MTNKEFLVEIQTMDSRFSLKENPNCPGLTNIFFEGVNYDLPVVSSNEIKDDIDHSYRYTFNNGYSARFWSKPEIMARLTDFLTNFENIKKEYAD